MDNSKELIGGVFAFEGELKHGQREQCLEETTKGSPTNSAFGSTILDLANLHYFPQGSHIAGYYSSFEDFEFFRNGYQVE